MTNLCVSAACYLIERTNEYNNSVDFLDQIAMSCKRLQKLLYFAEVVYMKIYNGKPMLEDKFYAWPSGPVIPEIYDEFIQYQNGKMMPIEIVCNQLSSNMKDTLKLVFEKTVNIDTNTLVEMTQVFGGPWNQVYDPSDKRHLQIITKESMYNFAVNSYRIK